MLARPPEDIVAFATRRRRAVRPPAGAGVASRAGSEAESDAARFAAVLREGPGACLQRAERRPPGDLVVAWSEALYPDQLRDLGDPPLCLFVRGGADREKVAARVSAHRGRAGRLGGRHACAVVVRRGDGAQHLRRAARAGVIVASGMAMGIDAVAQAAAVDAEALDPATVAVLGCGADVVYPRCNARLYARVAATGLVLSEFAWGVPRGAWRFPARNRVIAGLARAVVLVQGAERSGARITVGHGVDAGREIRACPARRGGGSARLRTGCSATGRRCARAPGGRARRHQVLRPAAGRARR